MGINLRQVARASGAWLRIPEAWVAVLGLVAISVLVLFVVTQTDTPAPDEELGQQNQSNEPLLVSADSVTVASDVVDATVVSTRFVNNEWELRTVATIDIAKTHRGRISGQAQVEVPGGEAGDIAMFVTDMPLMRVGDRLQLALVLTTAPISRAIDPDGGRVYAVAGGAGGAVNLDSGDLRLQIEPGDGRLNGSAVPASQNFRLIGKTWPEFPVQYFVNINQPHLDPDLAATIIHDSVALWEDLATSDIDFDSNGTTQRLPTSRFNGENIIGWVNTPNRADTYVARTTIWTRLEPSNRHELVAFDIKLNDDHEFVNGAVAGKHDLKSVLLHELGHVLGLADSPAESEIMFGSIPPGTQKMLGAGDEAGLAQLYPVAGLPQ